MESTEREISLLDVWLVLREGWHIIAIGMAVGLAFALLTALVMSPIYRSSAVISVVESDPQSAPGALLSQLGGFANVVGLDTGSGRGANEGLTVLRSRTFIEEFITEHDLLPVLYHETWDRSEQEWTTETPPAVWEVADYFLSEVFTLTEDSETGLITVVVEWTDPVKSSVWANSLVSLANESIRMRDINETERRIAYLNEQIEGTSVVELRQVLYNLLEAEYKTLMLANARREYVFKFIDRAVARTKPSKPNLRFLIVLGLFAGAMSGLATVFIRQLFRSLRAQEKARQRA